MLLRYAAHENICKEEVHLYCRQGGAFMYTQHNSQRTDDGPVVVSGRTKRQRDCFLVLSHVRTAAEGTAVLYRGKRYNSNVCLVTRLKVSYLAGNDCAHVNFPTRLGWVCAWIVFSRPICTRGRSITWTASEDRRFRILPVQRQG